MATLVTAAFAALPHPVVINPTTAVVGYDARLREPVLDVGHGPIALSEVQRGSWDAGDEAFSPAEEAKIEEAIKHLRR